MAKRTRPKSARVPQDSPPESSAPLPADPSTKWVSRGGAKLDHALAHFAIDVTGFRCADLGCSTGGFSDCLLQRGAAHVYAVDTGYGVLDWRLRSDARVTVRERENALHAEPATEPMNLVTIDLGWTPQRLAIPAALRWIGPDGTIVSLVKPHYEASDVAIEVPRGGLPDELAERVMEGVLGAMAGLGVTVLGVIESPIRGAKSSRRGAGNREFLAWLRPTGSGIAAAGSPVPSEPPGTGAAT